MKLNSLAPVSNIDQFVPTLTHTFIRDYAICKENTAGPDFCIKPVGLRVTNVVSPLIVP